MGEVIAVLSGKGGTGKTAICAGIATSLADEGLQILCIDCDAGLRNLDIFLGLSHTAPLSFSDALQTGAALEKLPPHPQFPTLRFLTAPTNRSLEQTDRSAFLALVRRARQQFDYVLLDAPAGVGTGFHLAATAADRILTLTCADPAAIRDAARTGQLLEQLGKQDVRLIVNRIDPGLLKAMDLTVDDVMDGTGLPLLGIVPEDAHILLAASAGRPLLLQTKKGAAAACRRIASRLQGKAQTIPSKLI